MKPAKDSVGAIFDERFSTSISPPPQKEDDWLCFFFDHYLYLALLIKISECQTILWREQAGKFFSELSHSLHLRNLFHHISITDHPAYNPCRCILSIPFLSRFGCFNNALSPIGVYRAEYLRLFLIPRIEVMVKG